MEIWHSSLSHVLIEGGYRLLIIPHRSNVLICGRFSFLQWSAFHICHDLFAKSVSIALCGILFLSIHKLLSQPSVTSFFAIFWGPYFFVRKLIMCIQTDGNTLIDIKMSYSLSPLRKTCLPPSWVCRSLYDPPAGPWPRLHKTTWIWTAQRHQRVSVDCILVLWIWWYSWECLFKKTNFSNCMRILFYTLSYKFRSGDD